MKATLRNRSAAALLTAPVAIAALLAAVFATPTVHAQHDPGAYVQLLPAGPVDPRPYDGYRHGGYRNDGHRNDAYRHDGYRQGIDRRAPRITAVTPTHGDRVSDRGRTEISARLVDWGSGIDHRTVSLRVDGRDVTHRVRLDQDELRYREDLAPGRHHAEISVRDRAGNLTRHVWTFDVVDRDRGQRFGYYDDGGRR